jgi:carbon monoxide dehydrogenase subunit G
MSIQFEHSVDVSRGPERAFAVLDDFAQTPKWLARCTDLTSVSPGPHAVGTKLRYQYKEAGRTGTMDGEITARTPNERLTMHYLDKMMEVTVDFRIAKTDTGARLTHAIEIKPRTLVASLMSPLIRRSLPKQTVTAMVTLKALLEKGE